MNDPQPENITGEKWVGHTVEHKIDWGHVALGIGLLALVALIWRVVDVESDEDDENADF